MKEVMTYLDFTIIQIGNAPLTVGGLLASIVVLVFGLWIAGKLRHVVQRVISPRFGIHRSTGFALGAVVFYIVVTITFICTLSLLGFDLKNLAIVAGALSVGIGLGLQNIANNFVSGLLLLFDRSIKVGDYVELGNGSRGTTSIFLRTIHQALNENGFEIPFPQRDVHIRTTPAAKSESLMESDQRPA